MDYLLGNAINLIRKGQQIPVRNIVRCGVSKSQYFRFIKGESSLNVETFLSLIDELNVTISEFLYISRGYQDDPYTLLFKKIENAFYKRDSDCLIRISQNANRKYLAFGIDKFQHISAIALILKSRLDNEPIPKLQFKTIKNYIFSLSLWSHYDLCVFMNVLFAFKIEDIRFLLKRIQDDENKFSDLENNIAGSFRIGFNLMIMDLEQGDISELLVDYDFLRKVKLDDNHMLEHVLLTYMEAVVQVIHGNKDGQKKLMSIQIDLERYGISSYANVLKNINDFLLKKYM